MVKKAMIYKVVDYVSSNQKQRLRSIYTWKLTRLQTQNWTMEEELELNVVCVNSSYKTGAFMVIIAGIITQTPTNPNANSGAGVLLGPIVTMATTKCVRAFKNAETKDVL